MFCVMSCDKKTVEEISRIDIFKIVAALIITFLVVFVTIVQFLFFGGVSQLFTRVASGLMFGCAVITISLICYGCCYGCYLIARGDVE